MKQFRERDTRILLLLGWAVIVLLFFSASPGKRGLYILPMLPAVALASGEWLRGLWQRPDVQRTGSIFAVVLIVASFGAFAYLQWIAPGAPRRSGRCRTAVPRAARDLRGSRHNCIPRLWPRSRSARKRLGTGPAVDRGQLCHHSAAGCRTLRAALHRRIETCRRSIARARTACATRSSSCCSSTGPASTSGTVGGVRAS